MFMKSDGVNSNTITPAPTSNEAVKKLKAVQQRLWAIMGLKAGLDRLRGLGYEVVAQCEPDGSATIKIQFKVHFDFDSGTLGGKDLMAMVDELQKQINDLEGNQGKK